MKVLSDLSLERPNFLVIAYTHATELSVTRPGFLAK